MIEFSSWGRLKKTKQKIIDLKDRFNLPQLCKDEKYLVFGNARSYGDVCTNFDNILLRSNFLDHYINFNQKPISNQNNNEKTNLKSQISNYTITVESGLLLKDIQRFLVPKGFMLPVTPGTQLITVGGAIANDVHCKNHHLYGTFGHYVENIVLARSDGQILNCNQIENKELFKATIGGIGLTGIILEATIRLKKVTGPWINAENIPYQTLKEFFQLTKDSVDQYEHTVSWIDCITGNGERGIFMRGNDNTDDSLYKEINSNIKVPFTMPISLVNKLSLHMFNKSYYFLQKIKSKPFKVHYEKFFYPLDGILEWNRIYGPKGFYQYQCVVPMDNGFDAIKEIQKEIAKSGQGSFLGVLKTFGNIKSIGLLSFPQEGFTYALDFPNKGKQTEKLFERLDRIVLEANGRLYLAKDARQPKELFEKGYGLANIEEFLKYKDPLFSSDLSRRLLGV